MAHLASHLMSSTPASITTLSINFESANDTDGSNNFEGPEKLLEVWFTSSEKCLPVSAKTGGLKAVSEDRWREMLDMVHCKVLSVVRSDVMDAYLLSESSMFVFPHKLILKTCGTTTLLAGMPMLLEIAARDAGFEFDDSRVPGAEVAAKTHRIFYSRKQFMFPTQQKEPHSSWDKECAYLDKIFDNGSAYLIGKMNAEHWYLYLTNPTDQYSDKVTREEEEPRPSLGASTDSGFDELPLLPPKDETLEILMCDLDPEYAKKFYFDHASAVARVRAHKLEQEQGLPTANGVNGHSKADASAFDVFDNTPPESPLEETPADEGHALGTAVTESTGLAEIYPRSSYPDARIDSYMFSPCGYSANGVIPSMAGSACPSTHYFTVHVTPEPHCSYASFETNVPSHQAGRKTAEIIEHVVNIFKPGKFTATLFVEREEDKGNTGTRAEERRVFEKRMDSVNGYRRVDKIVHDLDGYDLDFRYYTREQLV